MGVAEGFDWSRRKNGDVVITHHGRAATVLRGRAAERLLADLAGAEDAAVQQRLARVTGNYRRGNERAAGRGRR